LLKQAFQVAKKEQYITVNAAMEYGGIKNGMAALAPKLSKIASMKNGAATTMMPQMAR